MGHYFPDERFTKYGAILVLIVILGILLFISFYLSASNGLCVIQQRPWVLGHRVPGMCTLSQCRGAGLFQASPSVYVPFPLFLNETALQCQGVRLDFFFFFQAK